jgi:TonB family protein
MQRAAWTVMTAVALAGCVPPRPAPAPPGAVVVQPVEVTTTYIAAYAPRSSRGRYAIVEICIAADGGIASARVTETSTDKAFDDAALRWAQQAHYRPQLENGRPVFGCREVRVEVNPAPGPHLGGADSALG